MAKKTAPKTRPPQRPPIRRGRAIVWTVAGVVGAIIIGLIGIYLSIVRDIGIQWARTVPPFVGIYAVEKPRGEAPATATATADYLAAIDLGAIRAGSSAVPRLYLARLPADMADFDTPAGRKNLFLRAMLPLILLVNEHLTRLRGEVLRIADLVASEEPLGPEDRDLLDRLMEWYGVQNGQIDVLIRRVDAVPPSLALAQAAIESGWGTSRFAQIANAVYGQHAFADDKPQVEHPVEGIPPIRAFPDLISSVSTYMHNLNSHRAYRGFRSERAKMRAAGKALDADALAAALVRYSERGEDYVAAVREIMRPNKLSQFDSARLAP